MTGLVVGCSVITIIAVAAVLTAPGLARRAPTPSPSVIAPLNGQQVPAKPVTIKVQLGGSELVGARLNGRSILSEFQHQGSQGAPCGPTFGARSTVCLVEASPSQGLRFGTNVLRVTFGRGTRAQVRTVRFRVAGVRPLAAAGSDRTWILDKPMRLDGRASLAAPRTGSLPAFTARAQSLRYRWQVIRAPRRPGARSGEPGASVPSPGWIADADTARPRIAFYRLGRYTLRLTVSGPTGPAGSDTVTIDAGGQGETGTPRIAAAPVVHVQTMAKVDNRWGVLLQTYRNYPLENCPQTIVSSAGDSCFYPDEGNARDWLQLVVLERKDDPNDAGGSGLTLVENKQFPCQRATDITNEQDFDTYQVGPDPFGNNQNTCIRALVDYINGLHPDDLVIAVNQPGNESDKSIQPPVGVGAALSGKLIRPFDSHNLGIDATYWYNHTGRTPAVRGTFSAIGVPRQTSGGVSNLPTDPGSWDPQGSGRLDTDISVNNLSQYVPTQPSEAFKTKLPIASILTQAHTDWPKMTAGQAAALSAVGDFNPDKGTGTVGLGPDPRAQYYTLDQSDAAWLLTRDHINNLSCRNLAAQGCDQADSGQSAFPGVVPFTADDLRVAKKWLTVEIEDLVRVDSYLNTLAKPLVSSAETLQANLGTIEAQINAGTVNEATQAWVTGIGQVIGGALELIPAAGEFFKWGEKAVAVAEAVATAYSLSSELAETYNSGRADEPFAVQAAEFKEKLSERLVASQQEITQQWRNIIVADWGKLDKVAQCTYPNSDCGDVWHNQTFADTKSLETFYKSTLKREAYETLVPMKYPWALSLGILRGANKHLADDAANFCRPASPYTSETGVIVGHTTVPPNDIYAPFFLIASDVIPVAGDLPKAVSKTVFERMFSPYDEGGLGIDPQQFLKASYIDNSHTLDYRRYFRFTLCPRSAGAWRSG